ncbi:MAG: hypothetical protein K6G30_06865 [Acetatifactor sp.]|nr:hypothetical protein [Acetatifactor sp.]
MYQHFREYGLKEGRSFNQFFDVCVYRERYPDLEAAFGDDWDAYLEHYLTFGIYEKRSPAKNGGIFDIDFYKETYPDVGLYWGIIRRYSWNIILCMVLMRGVSLRNQHLRKRQIQLWLKQINIS